MNILLNNIFFVRFMVSEIPRVSVFWHCPYSITFPYYLIKSYVPIIVLYTIDESKYVSFSCRKNFDSNKIDKLLKHVITYIYIYS